jgi:divalent metal cation (Fe/Co/Zn/Cd) transporter
MAKLTFKYTTNDYTENNREINKVSIEVPDDMNIYEFKEICERLALTIGYQKASIRNAFDTPNHEPN